MYTSCLSTLDAAYTPHSAMEVVLHSGILCLFRVAYRTQVIGGVVVRVPIKADEVPPVKKTKSRNTRGAHVS